MSWQDRDYAGHDENPHGRFGRPGGDWQGVRPSFDNPLTWAITVGRVIDIDVRVHVTFLLLVVIMLLRSFGTPTEDQVPLGLLPMALSMICLFLIVLVHEFGHCLACRRTGGSANEILMWPLGGLAYCLPPQRWQAHLVTAAGGPLVNVAICLAITPVLGALTGRWWGLAVPDPLSFVVPYEATTSWAIMVLYFLNQLSLMLLLFNLLPMFPLDGGRILQALVWPKFGYARSMRIAVRAGYVGAAALGVFALVTSSLMLLAIALFGGGTCYLTYRQLQFTEQTMGFSGDAPPYGQTEEPALPPRPSWRQRQAKRRAERRRHRELQEAREVDRILAKIARSGLESLSGPERRLLKRTTDRRRQQS